MTIIKANKHLCIQEHLVGGLYRSQDYISDTHAMHNRYSLFSFFLSCTLSLCILYPMSDKQHDIKATDNEKPNANVTILHEETVSEEDQKIKKRALR